MFNLRALLFYRPSSVARLVPILTMLCLATLSFFCILIVDQIRVKGTRCPKIIARSPGMNYIRGVQRNSKGGGEYEEK